jgi:hypothetical protein
VNAPRHQVSGPTPVVLAVLAGLAGAALLAFAWRCDGAWFERHVFLPYYFVPPTRGALGLRGAAAALASVSSPAPGQSGAAFEVAQAIRRRGWARSSRSWPRCRRPKGSCGSPTSPGDPRDPRGTS